MPRIAISYRRSDTQAMTGRIFDRLVDRYGDESVFMDIDKIPLGYDFRDQIRQFLEQSDIVLAVIGPEWLGRRDDGSSRLTDETDPVRFEMETSLGLKKALIPVLVNDATMPRAADLPESLKQFVYFNAAEIDAGRDFRVHMDRLMKAMDQIFARQAPAKEPDPLPSAAPVIAPEPDPPPAPSPVHVRKPEPAPPVQTRPEQARPEPPARPAPEPPAAPADPVGQPDPPAPRKWWADKADSAATPAVAPAAAPVREFAAAIDWPGIAAWLAYALGAAIVSLGLYYGFVAQRNDSTGGMIFTLGTMLAFFLAGLLLYWRRGLLGGKALVMGAIAGAAVLAIVLPTNTSANARAFEHLGPLAMIGVLVTREAIGLIAIVAVVAAVGDMAGQAVTRLRHGRERTYGLLIGLVTRARRKPLLPPLAPARGRRRLAVIACLVAFPALILGSAQLTEALSDNETLVLDYVIVSAGLGLLAGFLASRLAGILGAGAAAMGAAIGLLANLLAWTGQQALRVLVNDFSNWDFSSGPFYFGQYTTRYGTTVYYAVAMALAALAGSLLAQMLADAGRRRGFLASLTSNPVAVILGGFVIAAVASYIAFRWAMYPYCLAHTPFTLPGLCSST